MPFFKPLFDHSKVPFSQLSESLQKVVMRYPANWTLLLKSDIKAEELNQFSAEKLELLLDNILSLQALLDDTDATFCSLNQFDSESLKYILDNHYKIRGLCKDEGLSFQTFPELDFSLVQSLVEKPESEISQKFLIDLRVRNIMG